MPYNQTFVHTYYPRAYRRDSVVATEARLWTRQPTIRASFPGRGKRFLSAPKRPEWLWGHQASSWMGNGGGVSSSKVGTAWCWLLTSIWLRD